MRIRCSVINRSVQEIRVVRVLEKERRTKKKVKESGEKKAAFYVCVSVCVC